MEKILSFLDSAENNVQFFQKEISYFVINNTKIKIAVIKMLVNRSVVLP